METAADDVLSIAQELVAVTRLVEDDDLPTALERFVARVVRTVPGCDHAIITVRGDGGPEAVAGLAEPGLCDTPGEPLAAVSPVGEVLAYREPRRIDDVTSDLRWPVFSERMGLLGYRSCLILPLHAEHAPAASFSLLSRTPDQFGAATYDLVLLFALHGGAVFDNVSLFHNSRRLVDQLTAALGTRQTIGLAQGLIMLRFGCDTDASFELLRTASQNTNTKLREVAQRLVQAHEADKLSAAMADFGLEPVA